MSRLRVLKQERKCLKNRPKFALNDLTAALGMGHKEQLSLVNGFSVLHSAAREMLLNITGRCACGSVTLPTLNFVPLVAQARNQKADTQKKPPQPPAREIPFKKRMRASGRSS